MSAQEQNKVAVLEVVQGPEGAKGRRVAHKGIPLVIGRSAQVDLIIADPKVSKNHSVVEKRGNSYYIIDLDSKNGTVLNGERIIRPEGAQLGHGDEILIADNKLKFYLFENLADAEYQAVQKRINYNAIQKYSNKSAVLFCEIPGFREMYTMYEVAEVDKTRDMFLSMYRDLVHEGGPYYAEPRGERGLACFETSVGAVDFAKTLFRRLGRKNLELLRDPKGEIKKIDIRVAIAAGSLSLVMDDEGRIESVSGNPVTAARGICESAGPGELLITEEVYSDIPSSQQIGLEPKSETGKFGTLYKYLSDTTAYL